MADTPRPPREPRHHRRESCRLCGSRDLERVLELTPTPPANAFVPEALRDVPQQCFPLDVYFCRRCRHAQLLDVIDASDLFESYVYVSGTSPVNVDHFRRYAAEVVETCGLERGDLVVEIGSNDGTMLRFFRDAGMRVLGVDPAREIAAAASAAGIETLPEFFTRELARDIRGKHGPASVVCANNVCAHIDDLEAAVGAARELIEPAGTFVFQVSYLLDVFRDTLFDTIYHEHVDYHRVGPLVGFFDRLGMRLVATRRVEAQGGSLRGYVAPSERDDEVRPSVAEMEAAERAAGLDAPEALRGFERRIRRAGVELTALLEGLASRGRRIAGYGAPAKATTLMYTFGLDGALIDFIVEDNPLKHGLYTPGRHVPVVPVPRLYESRPDYVVALAWNFAESIVSKHRRFTDEAGRFVIPLPSLGIR